MATSFDQFVESLRRCETAADIVAASEVLLAEVPTWSGAHCRAWALRLLSNELVQHVDAPDTLGDDESPASAVQDRALAILEALLARMAALREPDPGIGKSVLLEAALVHDDTTLEIPRSYLLPAYREWIREDFRPAVGAYLRQVSRKANAGERIAIAKWIEAAGNQSLECFTPWLKKCLPDVYALEPDLLPKWLQWIELDPGHEDDFEAIALTRRLRRLLARFPAGTELPREFEHYLCFPRIETDAMDSARRVLESLPQESVHVRVPLLVQVLDRDARWHRGELEPHLESACCPEAAEPLREYRRIGSVANPSCATTCLLLCFAIEQQTRWALGRGLEPQDRSTVLSKGLNTLAKFLDPNCRVNMPRHLRVHPESRLGSRFEVASTMLERAGKIRNEVHHELDRVREASADDLRRFVFDERLMQDIVTLRCERER